MAFCVKTVKQERLPVMLSLPAFSFSLCRKFKKTSPPDINRERKKIYLRSFGCQMNDYDSARIIDLMREQGYERTAQPENADLLVVVTCSIREKAQEKPSPTWGA